MNFTDRELNLSIYKKMSEWLSDISADKLAGIKGEERHP
jgi:hypothetical protein